MLDNKSIIKTHISLLKQILITVNIKYTEIFADTKNYYSKRQKRGFVNSLRTICRKL